jgi:serine/threonine-protein kinase
VAVKVTGHFDLLTPILAVFFGGTNLAFSSTATADIVETPFTAGSTPTSAPSSAPPTAQPTVTPIPTPSGIPASTPSPTPPVCALPIANFTWAQLPGKDVSFTSTSTPTSGTCAITFWRWEFGDQTTSAGNPPTTVHTYPKNNTNYWVTLTVTNPAGVRSITIQVTS